MRSAVSAALRGDIFSASSIETMKAVSESTEAMTAVSVSAMTRPQGSPVILMPEFFSL
jgi:hypothetical protein